MNTEQITENERIMIEQLSTIGIHRLQDLSEQAQLLKSRVWQNELSGGHRRKKKIE